MPMLDGGGKLEKDPKSYNINRENHPSENSLEEERFQGDLWVDLNRMVHT